MGIIKAMRLVPHTIHRSVFGELLAAFVLGLVTFNFILVTERVIRLTKVFASVGAGIGDMLRIILLLQPQITVLTAPIALLIAVLLVYGRMGADNELTVMRSSGMSFRAVSTPVFALGAGCFALALASSFWVAPLGAGRLRESVSDIVVGRAPLAVEEGVFNTSFKGVVVFVGGKTEDGELRDIFIHDGRREGEPTVLFARQGKIEATSGTSVSFDLRDGRIHVTREDSATELSFGRYVLSFPLSGKDKPEQSYAELSPPGLWAAARGAEGKERTRVLLELHRRLSLPSLCLILMVLGPPLSLLSGRRGRLGGLAMGLMVFALYYTAVVYTEGLAMSGSLPHWLGAWGPATAFAALSALMFWRASSK